MGKVFLDELPKQDGFGANKGIKLINWKLSVGYEIEFVNENIKGVLKIINYMAKGQRITVEYNGGEYTTKTNNLINGKLDFILNPRTKEYKYNIGDIIENKFSKIRIIKQTTTKRKTGQIVRCYEYQCLKCGNIDIILEYNISKEIGCNVCCVPCKKVIKGINDIATTHPYLIKYFVNIEDTYTHSYSCQEKVLMKCPECGEMKEMQISNLYFQGFSCSKCSDGISYPEKIMYNILQQLDIEFEYQKTFKWSKNKKYDFYIENKLIIIETHGEQHYRYTGRGRSLEEEQENDKFKKELALNNDIKEESYIVVDCRYSDLEFIKSNIMKSNLSQLLNFKESDIDWLKCHELALSNLVKVACGLWHSGIYSTVEIGKIMKIKEGTILRYLKQGTKLKWCDYSIDKSKKYRIEKSKNSKSKKVKCITLDKKYNSLIEAEKDTGVVYPNIIACCNGKQHYAGKLNDGTKLVWCYI